MRRRGLAVAACVLLLALPSCMGASARERAVPTTSTTTTTTTTTTTLPPTTTTTKPPPPPTTRPKPPPPKPAVAVRSIVPFHGLGTWVDVYDFSPEFTNGNPPITPAAVDAMAAAGVKTLYLQSAKDDERVPADTNVLDPELVAGFITHAHAKGMRVVGWYLPKFADVNADLRRLVAMANFRASGQGFDSLGVDIEWRKDVPDPAERSARLVQLSQRLRASVGGIAIGAIVLPPVVTEVINPQYWPGFPWAGIKTYYDVWLPMAYWTNRSQESGYRDAYKYIDENIRRVRNDLGNQAAAVHAIGGIGDQSTLDDYNAFVRALVTDHAIGGSVYDYRTTAAANWPALRGVPQ